MIFACDKTVCCGGGSLFWFEWCETLCSATLSGNGILSLWAFLCLMNDCQVKMKAKKVKWVHKYSEGIEFQSRSWLDSCRVLCRSRDKRGRFWTAVLLEAASRYTWIVAAPWGSFSPWSLYGVFHRFLMELASRLLTDCYMISNSQWVQLCPRLFPGPQLECSVTCRAAEVSISLVPCTWTTVKAWHRDCTIHCPGTTYARTSILFWHQTWKTGAKRFGLKSHRSVGPADAHGESAASTGAAAPALFTSDTQAPVSQTRKTELRLTLTSCANFGSLRVRGQVVVWVFWPLRWASQWNLWGHWVVVEICSQGESARGRIKRSSTETLQRQILQMDPNFPHQLSRTGTITCLLIPAAGLLGWRLGQPYFRYPLPDLPPVEEPLGETLDEAGWEEVKGSSSLWQA